MTSVPPLELLTTAEACAELRIGRSTLFKLLKDGDLVATKIAGRTFLTRDELVRYVDLRRVVRRAAG